MSEEEKDLYSGFSEFMRDQLDKVVDNDSSLGYIKVSEDDDGELVLELPDDFMENLGWKVGDTLSWRQNSDDSWSIRKMN